MAGKRSSGEGAARGAPKQVSEKHPAVVRQKPAAKEEAGQVKRGRSHAGLLSVEVDLLVEAEGWPARDELAAIARKAVDATLAQLGARSRGPSELSLVFSNDGAIKELNAGWRGKDKPTNVLSFPAFPIEPGDPLPPMLGDIVLAIETISREASLEEKLFEHHLTHLIIHGLLHLLGYDHETDEEAEAMETTERRVLARLAIPDPYA
jgi:probable rRNA maturation factor